MSLGAVSDGSLTVIAWPTYVGVCQHDPGPGPTPYGEPQGLWYQRGEIHWAVENGDVIGRAFVLAGPGRYTHLAYFHSSEGLTMCGKVQLPHPIAFRRSGVIEIYPITNTDLRLLKAQGCPS